MSKPNPSRSGNPAKSRQPPAQQPQQQSGLRAAVSNRSRGILVQLAMLPPIVIPAVMLVLMLVGLTGPVWLGLIALGLAAVFVGWLAFISWPALDTKGRLVRGLMLGLVIGAGVGRANGWL